MSDFYTSMALLRGEGARARGKLEEHKWLEEEEERRLELERARGIETRARKTETARGRGRLGGGILGLLIATALAPVTAGASLAVPLAAAAAGAGLGSYAGQKVATDPKWGPPGMRISPGAMKTFERIGPGKYYISRGEERERQFEWGESERERYLSEQILASAAMDAISGAGGTYYAAGKGYGSILDMILRRGGGAGAEAAVMEEGLPFSFNPFAGGRY